MTENELLREPPEVLTHSRRMAALDAANERRRERKQLRALLKDKEIDPIKLVRGDLTPFEPLIADLTVERLLKLIPRMGSVRTFTVLAHLPGQPNERVKDITFERRERLAKLVDDARALRL